MTFWCTAPTSFRRAIGRSRSAGSTVSPPIAAQPACDSGCSEARRPPRRTADRKRWRCHVSSGFLRGRAIGPAVPRDVEVPRAALRNGQRGQRCLREMPRQEDDLADVVGVMGQLPLDGLEHRVRLAADRHGRGEVFRRESPSIAEKQPAPAVLPAEREARTGCRSASISNSASRSRSGFSPSVVRKSVQRDCMLPARCFITIAMLFDSAIHRAEEVGVRRPARAHFSARPLYFRSCRTASSRKCFSISPTGPTRASYRL